MMGVSTSRNSRRVTLGDRQKYEFIESEENCLGEGGYGQVFKGRNRHERTDVAVKMVKINEKTKKYVDREKDFMEKCNFRNAVTIFAAIPRGSFMYFILEYCILGSLSKFYKEQRERVSFGQSFKFMRDIAHGLQHLHCLVKICHRDIKPANILVQNDNDGREPYMKIADFGLARNFPDSASSISITRNVGTVGWSAPEIFRSGDSNRNYHFPVDIFSLGLVFLAMLKHQLGHHLEPHQGMSLSF